MKLLLFFLFLPICLYTNTSEEATKLSFETPINNAVILLKNFKKIATNRNDADLLLEFATATKRNIQIHKEKLLLHAQSNPKRISAMVNNAKATFLDNVIKLKSRTLNGSLDDINRIEGDVEHCNHLLQKYLGYKEAFDQEFRIKIKKNDPDSAIKKSIVIIGTKELEVLDKKHKLETKTQHDNSSSNKKPRI